MYTKWLTQYYKERGETGVVPNEHIVYPTQRQTTGKGRRQVEDNKSTKRVSLLSSMRMFSPAPKREVNSRCVGCQAPVTPGMCYTGSVIAGIAFSMVESTETTPITGVITCEAPPASIHMIGGEEYTTQKRVAFHKRNKGYLCDTCASNYHTIEDKHGVKHPIVTIDVRPGFIGSLAIPLVERRF